MATRWPPLVAGLLPRGRMGRADVVSMAAEQPLLIRNRRSRTPCTSRTLCFNGHDAACLIARPPRAMAASRCPCCFNGRVVAGTSARSDEAPCAGSLRVVSMASARPSALRVNRFCQVTKGVDMKFQWPPGQPAPTRTHRPTRSARASCRLCPGAVVKMPLNGDHGRGLRLCQASPVAKER
jgi:hypothetical protein